MSEFIITTSEEGVMKFSTNDSNIVIKADPKLRYILMWNVNDVLNECNRKGWVLEKTDYLRSRR